MVNKYAFSFDNQDNRDIQAYWYNVPEHIDAFKNPKFNVSTFSSLCIYGYIPSNKFIVKATVSLGNHNIIFSKIFNICLENNSDDYEIEIQNGFFKLTQRVKYTQDLPDEISIEIIDANITRIKKIECIYHKLYGKVEDFNNNPFKAFVNIAPDTFEEGIGVWSDEEGKYEITLPERIYNSIFVDDETYGINTVEAWGWHIIMDCNQELNFKVGTGEVYNLNAWANNGGGRTFFISFRPMLLMPKTDAKSNNTLISDEDIFANMYEQEVDGKVFNILDLCPELNDKNIKIKFDETNVNIYSVIKYYEIVSDNMAMPAYIVQVDAKNIKRNGKHTIKVEYHSQKSSRGIIHYGSSMGCYQIYMNFNGSSDI